MARNEPSPLAKCLLRAARRGQQLLSESVTADVAKVEGQTTPAAGDAAMKERDAQGSLTR